MKKRLIIYIFLIILLLSGGAFIVKTSLIKSIVLDASYPFLKSVEEIKGSETTEQKTPAGSGNSQGTDNLSKKY